MINPTKQTPKYINQCPYCIFLGRYKYTEEAGKTYYTQSYDRDIDMYFCKTSVGDTLNYLFVDGDNLLKGGGVAHFENNHVIKIDTDLAYAFRTNPSRVWAIFYAALDQLGFDPLDLFRVLNS